MTSIHPNHYGSCCSCVTHQKSVGHKTMNPQGLTLLIVSGQVDCAAFTPECSNSPVILAVCSYFVSHGLKRPCPSECLCDSFLLHGFGSRFGLSYSSHVMKCSCEHGKDQWWTIHWSNYLFSCFTFLLVDKYFRRNCLTNCQSVAA